jgi:hypothetical protein
MLTWRLSWRRSLKQTCWPQPLLLQQPPLLVLPPQLPLLPAA